MTTVLDLRQSDDPRDVVHRTVEALAGGEIVVLPTESEYVGVASLSQVDSVKRLRELDGVADDGLGLMFRSPELASDWVPRVGPVGRRLLDRCSPGPVVYSWDVSVAREGAMESVDAVVRSSLTTGGRFRGWVPSSDFVVETLQLLPEPVVFAPFDPDRVDLHGPPNAPSGDHVLVVTDGMTRFDAPATIVSVDDERFRILRSGCVEETTIQRLASRVIVFVCTGNTCRSPMAASLFRQLLAERLGCDVDDLGSRGFLVESAGLSAGYGSPASPEAVSLLAERGIDLVDHASRPLTTDTLRAADHVWTMTAGHLRAIQSSGAETGLDCGLLAPSGEDVADPFGGDRAIYADCLTQIEGLLRERLDQVLPKEGAVDALERDSNERGRT